MTDPTATTVIECFATIALSLVSWYLGRKKGSEDRRKLPPRRDK